MEQIKVAIVDDDPDWIKVMKLFLKTENDISIIWTATTKEEVIQFVKKEPPDVITMDIDLGQSKYNGVDVALELSKIVDNLKIIMLSSMSDELHVNSSFSIGAVNYLTKSNFKEVPFAIRSTFYKHSPIEHLLKEFKRLKQEEELSVLSPAEREIYDLMNQGYKHSQIGEIKYKSPHTIKNQVRSIIKKLQKYPLALSKIRTRSFHRSDDRL